MSKCKPKYKNLNLIQSYSDQKYAVQSWAEQNCQNDEWLRQNVEKLKYLSPASIRKRSNLREFIDENQSYGYMLTGDNEAIFSNALEESVHVDFTDMDLIDESKTTTFLEKYTDFEDGETKYRMVVPMDEEHIQNDFSTALKNNNQINSFWYVGYDKNKPYVLNSSWVKNPKHADIPSVVRAQTFKVKMDSFDSSITEGYLEAVTLSIQNTGEITHGWSSPLYVQVWNTTKTFKPVTEWIKNKRESVYKFITVSSLSKKSAASTTNVNNGQYLENYKSYSKLSRTTKKTAYKDASGNYYKVDNKNGTYYIKREYIFWPKAKTGSTLSINKPLAEGIFNPEETSPNWYTIYFNEGCKVQKGETYALVFFSPLSHPTHCPRIGGWGRNCTAVKYTAGDAFLSEDNGRTFVRYGHNDDTLTKDEYKFGRNTPQDFAFECKITTSSQGRDTEGEYYLYLKPILCNPINHFHIAGTVRGEDNGDTVVDGIHLNFEYSINGRDWNPLRMGESKYFTESHPNILFIRAKMTTTNANDTPNIEELYVHLTTDVAKQMYVRTQFYNPKLTPMLGANVWGRIYAPYVLTPADDDKISMGVEIIQEKLLKQHFHIITVAELDDYLSVQNSNGEFILDEESIVDKDEDERAKYLIDNPSVVKALKECNSNVYIKPYVLDDVEYLMSFDSGEIDEETEEPIFGGMNLTHSPAYPIQGCVLQSDSNEPVKPYGEWYDYTVDYNSDIVTFDKDVIDEMPIGGLVISYNPVFIQDLTLNEVGTRLDEETGLMEEGLILDYFKESYIINQKNIETRRIPLRVIPVDPIREVYLNKDTAFEEELYEDIDFTVDYENKELVFPILDDANQLSRLSLNDTLEVVYTPNLEDTGIAIGYFCNREDTNHQATIKSNYIEYKV